MFTSASWTLEARALACSCGLLVALAACGGEASKAAPADERVAVLESRVRELEAALTPDAQPSAGFSVACPAEWQTLGPIGAASWTCRDRRPLPDGFWPNCNVTAAPVQLDPVTGTAQSAREALETSLAAAPELRSARRLSERALELHGERAHEAVYEHDLWTQPLRVLTTVAVHAERVYALSCAAPPAAFAASEPAFRRIARSFAFER